jgi:endonuclease YncB( thermonuclease family)
VRRYKALVVAIAAASIFAAGSATATAAEAESSGINCSDFSSQRAAQLYFLRHGGPSRDPEGLDGEGDGIACESLPCPCYRGRSLPDTSPTPAPQPSPQPQPRPRNRRQTIKSRIIDVIDGDTIRVRTLEPSRRPTYRVRLIGIDTPEMRPLECGARQATHAAFSWSFDRPRDMDGDGLFDTRGGRGRRVVLVTDPSQGLFDRYRRLLAYVTIRERQTLNGFQLTRGWAKVYVFRKPFARISGFRTAQRRARRAHRGVWGLCGGRFHRPDTSPDETGGEVPPEYPLDPAPPPPPPPACDPSYPTVCIPPPPPDLDCSQISPRNFAVVGSDPHGFDGDGDGVGCEN